MLPAMSLSLFVCGCGRHCICLDWCEVWIIAVICIMLMENAGMNSAVQLGRTAVNSQVKKQGVPIRKDAGKTKQKSFNYM